MSAFICNGGVLTEWLKGIGIDVPLARRTVIDLQAGKPAKVYVEGYGDEKILSLRFPYERSEIEVHEMEKPDP